MLAGSLDTNILVRLVTGDEEVQTQAVYRMLARHSKNRELLFVPITVVLELEWVLRSRYGYPKEKLVGLLADLLTTVELSFESEDALEQALADYGEGKADFAEYLHLALSRKKGALPFFTFDRKAAKTKDVEVLV